MVRNRLQTRSACSLFTCWNPKSQQQAARDQITACSRMLLFSSFSAICHFCGRSLLKFNEERAEITRRIYNEGNLFNCDCEKGQEGECVAVGVRMPALFFPAMWQEAGGNFSPFFRGQGDGWVRGGCWGLWRRVEEGEGVGGADDSCASTSCSFVEGKKNHLFLTNEKSQASLMTLRGLFQHFTSQPDAEDQTIEEEEELHPDLIVQVLYCTLQINVFPSTDRAHFPL